MNYSLENWPFKWFGLWKEYGKKYEDYPSIVKFVDQKRNMKYEKNKLTNYLKNGYVTSVTSRMSFPSPFSGKIATGSISFKTDGKWLWLDDIIDYIEKNNLCIPEEMYQHIKLHNFVIPNVNSTQIAEIEWNFL